MMAADFTDAAGSTTAHSTEKTAAEQELEQRWQALTTLVRDTDRRADEVMREIKKTTQDRQQSLNLFKAAKAECRRLAVVTCAHIKRARRRFQAASFLIFFRHKLLLYSPYFFYFYFRKAASHFVILLWDTLIIQLIIVYVLVFLLLHYLS